jgi:hypothetical protein
MCYFLRQTLGLFRALPSMMQAAVDALLKWQSRAKI